MTISPPDGKLLDAFTAGTLDEAGQARLAEQVARLLPVHWMLPNRTAATLSTVIRQLGGDSALLNWLDRYPGLPRLTASVYQVIGLLDAVSDRPAVVTALQETRQRVGLPPELAASMVPDTTSETLASLAGRIESLLADGRYDEAVGLALETTELLHHLASRAAPVDPYLADLIRQLERIREKLIGVSDTM